jgi:hypothetical protein
VTWSEFVKAHWEALAATDFFAVEVWTGRGLVRYHVLFVIQLATRAVEIAGVVPEPNRILDAADCPQSRRSLDWISYIQSSIDS